MAKENISATVDKDVHEFLSQDHINTSGLVNDLVREYMNAGGDKDAIKQFRIEQLLEEAEDLSHRAERKREKAKELKTNRKEKAEREQQERREDIINNAKNIPADPENGYVVEHADELDMEPEELAQEIADTHNKEFDPFNNNSDDLRSL